MLVGVEVLVTEFDVVVEIVVLEVLVVVMDVLVVVVDSSHGLTTAMLHA